jgi:glycosyltransferase involved in cell wall biosynthesis
MRIALCTNYISPYRLPVFRALANQNGNELTIYTTASKGHDRYWNRCDQDGTIGVKQSWNCSILANQRVGVSSYSRAQFTESTKRDIPIGLLRDLLHDRPDVIISGELGMRTMIAKLAGLFLRVPVIPWTYPSPSKLKIGRIRSLYRKIMLKRSIAIIGMGSTARSALRDQGANEHAIFDAPNAADLYSIRQQRVRNGFANEVNQLRHRIGGDKKIAIVVGRLVEMKAPQRIIDSWLCIPMDIRNRWELVFIGDGPLASKLHEKARDGIQFVGNVSPEEVSTYFAACDLHIFASLGDPWGLVVNEAMHHAKPTLCSIHAGCYEDLIIEGKTGFSFDPTRHVEQVAYQIARVLTSDGLDQVGNRARLHASIYTPVQMADGMQRAIDHVIAHESRRIGKETT